ncbi:MAG: lipopolysaccharide heptosyltransferase II [Candidatus Omnitrophota bacterium]
MQQKKYTRILVIRLDRIGDILLSTPVLEALRSAYPQSYIAMMIAPHARPIVEGNPYINDFIIYDKEGPQWSFWNTLKFALSLRKQKFDTAIILHPSCRSHIIAFLAGIPKRIGYNKKFGFLLTHKLMDNKRLGLKHESAYALDSLRVLGAGAKTKPKLYFPIRQEDERTITKFLASMGVRATDSIVVVHPGASCSSKKWLTERFAEVAEKLSCEYKVKIVIVSGDEDAPLCEEIERAMKTKAISLAGKTSLGELAALLKRSKLFISNDSGPVHVAVAVQTPVISIFGRKQPGLGPRRWGPLGEKDIALHKDVGCAECKAHNCTLQFKCLKAITVTEVLAAARKILNEK